MKRVGITGGIGCGKSTVVAEFRKLGVQAFVADEVAAAYYHNPAFLADIRNLFGDEVFLADGSADLSLFRSHYDNVNSDNGDRVLAPGTAAVFEQNRMTVLGSTILGAKTGGYVLVALISFTIGVFATMFSRQYRKNKHDRKKED